MLKLYSNIKMQRQLRGWSQAELAKRVGYSDKSMISKIESGKIDLYQSQIQTFADAFGCSAPELMGWDDEAETKSNDELLVEAALEMYYKYLAQDSKTRRIIDQLLESDD